MESVNYVQIMSVLFFMYAIRMQVWKTSLNTFVIIGVIFFISMSREIDVLKDVWADYHLSIVSALLMFLMARIVFQQYKNCDCGREK